MSAWLAAHRRSVLFLIAIAALGGAVAAWQLPVALFPNIDFPRIAVNIDAGDRPSDRMVIEVTRPLEQALREVPDIGSIRSRSSRGVADISLNFAWGTDMVAAQLQVESALNRALPDLPPGIRFQVRRMDPTVFPIFGLTLTSDTRDLTQIRDLAYYTMRPFLSAIPGVAQVEVLGGRVAEYQVLVDPERLQAAGLSVDDVSRELTANNVVAAVGRLEDRYRLYLTMADSRLRSTDDVANTMLKAGPTGAIRLGDVAHVQLSTAPQWTRVTANGHDAVLINIRQSRGANSVNLVKMVREQLAAHAQEVPREIKVGTFYDQSELVSAAAGSVRDAILIGAILAGIVLLVFLRDLRLTMVVAIALPVTLSITTLLLAVFGMSFNIMTLGGMAAAVGLVVDDAVVIVEHLVRRLHERAGASQEAPGAERQPGGGTNAGGTSLLAAAQEMLKPLLGSSLATVVIFVPLAFLSGVTGGFFKALALTMACSLVVSFFIALVGVPLLTDRFIKRRGDAGHSPEQTWFRRLTERYARIGESALRHPGGMLIGALVLLALGGIALWRLPSGFMPHMDEGGFILDYRAPPGTSLSETDRLLRKLEGLIRDLPEVDSYSRRTGLQLGGGLTEANEGDFFIKLKSGPRRDIEEIMADLRTDAEKQIPGLTIETVQLMEDLIGDLTAVPQPIEVKLFGPDLAQLQALAPRVAKQLGTISGVVEIQDGLRIAGDAIEVRIDRARAAVEGLDPDEVSKQAGTLLAGTLAGQIQAGEKLLGVRVWTPQDLRTRIESVGELRVRSPDGHQLPLKRIADIEIAAGQPQLQREDLEQMVAVTARLEGRDLGSAIKDVKRAVAAMNLPPSLRVEYGGIYAEQQRSFRGLAAVFAAAVLLVTSLLLYLYERWAIVLAILATVALSVAAVFIGLWVTNTELNISAMMGLTMIVGIVAEIAVFYFSELEQEGDAAALLLAGRRRLRPILMTALIAILALMPLALGIGTGSAMQTPLAIAIISGLIAALPLVLVVMPVFYLLGARRRG
ncbi:MAG: efflux RND transporter permease subunit [Steroidobacteraceae bacterium]